MPTAVCGRNYTFEIVSERAQIHMDAVKYEVGVAHFL